MDPLEIAEDNRESLTWENDWAGDEVGYPGIEIVGCYSFNDKVYCYINSLTGEILEAWFSEED